MSNIKPAGYLNKFTGMIWNPEQQPGADSEPEIYEPLVRLSDVHGVVAENAALKSAFNPVEIPEDAVDAFGNTAEFDWDSNESGSWTWVENDTDVIRAVLDAMPKPETPLTDAFTAELRAQGVDEYAQAFSENTNMDFACNRGFYHGALDFAANLRAGRKG